MCGPLASPLVPTANLDVCAGVSASSSFSVLTLNDGCAAMICGEVAIRFSGAKSLTASYGGFEYTSELMLCGWSARMMV